MQDATIISSAIASRAAFEQVYKHVDPAEFSPLGAHLWPLVDEYYGRDKAALTVDASMLRETLKRVTDDRHVDTHLSYFDALPQGVSPQNVVNELLEVKRVAKGNELAAAITGGYDSGDLKTLLGEYEGLLHAVKLESSVVQYARGLDELSEVLGEGQKLPLFPKALNDKCNGGALPGDFIIIFARPEMGKTLFCVNLAANWLRLNKKILYIGNEDKIDKIKGRVRQNLANMTQAEVVQWQEVANERARGHGIDDRFIAVHLHPGTVYEIEELVREHEPDILIVDQLRNLGGEGKNMSSKLNQIAIDLRQLLSKYSMVGVAIAQANAGEHGKAKIWLESDDVDESRTGVPAQADLLIGVGANQEMLTHNNRAISFCKNKLSGEHEGIIVSVDTHRNIVT